jgi:predicted nuclease of restriction endonuclease-like (RecB) superfamily
MSKELTQNIDKLYQKIREILDNARNKTYYTANVEMVQAYWNIGREIVEEEQKGSERADYGKQLIVRLSEKLAAKYGTGFDTTNLWYMRQFYNTFKNLHAVSGELTWTHYRILLKVTSDKAREYYMQEAIACKWSTRQLDRQINTQYYERLLASGSKISLPKVAGDEKEQMQPEHIIKDPYVLEFLNLKNKENPLEKELENELLNKLQQFLLELGKGFTFFSRQYRISTESSKHYHVDLVFYNYILKCFILIDLKTVALSHADIGQMDFYVRYFEDKVKQPEDNPTIGLILCTSKDKTLVKYSLLNDSKQIFASKYLLYLPSEEELMEEIERERNVFEIEHHLKVLPKTTATKALKTRQPSKKKK